MSYYLHLLQPLKKVNWWTNINIRKVKNTGLHEVWMEENKEESTALLHLEVTTTL